MEKPEKEWLAAYRAGDVDALGKLVEHYRRPLFGFILKMTEGRDDAEEIFQEVWFRAINKLDSFRARNFLGWLFRIAHNLIIDRARKKKPDASLQDTTGDEGFTLQERISSSGLDPANVSEAHELGRRIAQAVTLLPDDQKEVFIMRTEGQLPFKEIARIQGVSINTALARMQYALAKLRETLAEDYEDLAGRTS